jgi:hypothetical protein
MRGFCRKVGAFSFNLRIDGNSRLTKLAKDLSGGDMKSMLGLVLLIASMFAQHAPNQTMFLPDQMQYGPVPGFLPSGAQLAVLEGDLTASSGDFTVRLWIGVGELLPRKLVATFKNRVRNSRLTFQIGIWLPRSTTNSSPSWRRKTPRASRW